MVRENGGVDVNHTNRINPFATGVYGASEHHTEIDPNGRKIIVDKGFAGLFGGSGEAKLVRGKARIKIPFFIDLVVEDTSKVSETATNSDDVLFDFLLGRVGSAEPRVSPGLSAKHLTNLPSNKWKNLSCPRIAFVTHIRRMG